MGGPSDTPLRASSPGRAHGSALAGKEGQSAGWRLAIVPQPDNYRLSFLFPPAILRDDWLTLQPNRNVGLNQIRAATASLTTARTSEQGAPSVLSCAFKRL